MVAPRQNDAPATPPVPEEGFQSQKDFSPLQKGGYENIPPVSGNKMGSSDSPTVTDMAVAAGVAAVRGYFTGQYSQAVEDMLNQFGVEDPNAKPANYVSRMMEGAAGKTGLRANLEKLRGDGDTINGVQEKDTAAVIRNAISSAIQSLKDWDGDAARKIATDMIDFGRLQKSDLNPPLRDATEKPPLGDRQRPEVEKRQRFNEAMAAIAEDFPDSFQASQELMQAAFKMAQTGKFDRDDLAGLARNSAKEFADDPNGDAARRFRELSEQLKADYGISITLGSQGLEITNEAKGTSASMVRVDENGVTTGNIDIGPGGTGASVPVEVAVKNIMETRRQNALESEKLGAHLGKILEGIGPKLEPTKPEGKEMPKPLPEPQKRYQRFENGNLLNLEML
ncbi:MAG: hypothetical protein IT342_02845 [Candidatus Melainabacteria bacterium]|nr:hypothetical protein [Candidatus Melainabacteria bacterium]